MWLIDMLHYYIIVYYTILYYIILNYIILYYIILKIYKVILQHQSNYLNKNYKIVLNIDNIILKNIKLY